MSLVNSPSPRSAYLAQQSTKTLLAYHNMTWPLSVIVCSRRLRSHGPPKKKRPSKKRSDDKLEHKWQLKCQRQAYEDTFI